MCRCVLSSTGSVEPALHGTDRPGPGHHPRPVRVAPRRDNLPLGALRSRAAADAREVPAVDAEGVLAVPAEFLITNRDFDQAPGAPHTAIVPRWPRGRHPAGRPSTPGAVWAQFGQGGGEGGRGPTGKLLRVGGLGRSRTADTRIFSPAERWQHPRPHPPFTEPHQLIVGRRARSGRIGTFAGDGVGAVREQWARSAQMVAVPGNHHRDIRGARHAA